MTVCLFREREREREREKRERERVKLDNISFDFSLFDRNPFISEFLKWTLPSSDTDADIYFYLHKVNRGLSLSQTLVTQTTA